MTSPDRLGRPFAALLAGEVRNVGLAVLREAALAALGLAGLCLIVATMGIRFREPLDLVPQLLLPGLLVALVLPWIAWKGDPPFGRAYLWTLPVRRQEAAVAKIAAGALWLVLALLAGLAMLAATALATGGTIGFEEVVLVGPAASGLAGATPVRWSTPLWMWLVPFGAALTLYLASSAAFLGLRHPLRFVGALALAGALLMLLAVNLGPHNALENGLTGLADAAIYGRLGLDFAVTGGVASLVSAVDTPGPGSTDLWSALPTAGRWAAALLVWFGAALIALALALRRHWER